jgi:hypothetical protein
MDRKTVFTKTAKAAFTMLAKEDIITPVVQAAQTHAKEAPVPPSQSPVVTDSDDDLGFTPLIAMPANKVEAPPPR